MRVLFTMICELESTKEQLYFSKMFDLPALPHVGMHFIPTCVDSKPLLIDEIKLIETAESDIVCVAHTAKTTVLPDDVYLEFVQGGWKEGTDLPSMWEINHNWPWSRE